MRTYSRLMVTAASMLALSALGGIAGLTATAQQPPSDTAEAEADDAVTDEDSETEVTGEASDESLPQDGGSGGADAPAQPAVPVSAGTTGEVTPAAISPETAPLGSSGGGGTGGNGRPTQDPVKDG